MKKSKDSFSLQKYSGGIFLILLGLLILIQNLIGNMQSGKVWAIAIVLAGAIWVLRKYNMSTDGAAATEDTAVDE